VVASSGAYAWDQAGKLPDNDLIDTQDAANAAEQTALPRVTPFPPADPVLAPAATSSSSLCALAAANGVASTSAAIPRAARRINTIFIEEACRMPKLSNRCQSSSAGSKEHVSIKGRRARWWSRREGAETMRNLPVLIVALGGLAAFVIPVAAESDHGSCATAPATSSPTIDLEAIPMMSAIGPKAVKSVGEDECGGDRSTGRGDEELDDSDD